MLWKMPDEKMSRNQKWLFAQELSLTPVSREETICRKETKILSRKTAVNILCLLFPINCVKLGHDDGGLEAY